MDDGIARDIEIDLNRIAFALEAIERKMPSARDLLLAAAISTGRQDSKVTVQGWIDWADALLAAREGNSQ